MDQRLQLLGKSLDALSVNVSVLAPDGTIVESNQSWREFGARNNIQMRPDTIGTNYLTVCEQSSTETATQTHRGLTELLAGTRDQFYIEYPCHSPIEQRWFLLQAVPMVLDNQRHAVVAHINITEQKRVERQLRRHQLHLEVLNDINTALQETTHLVIDQSARSEIEQAVCAALVDTDGYDCAQIGAVNGRTGSITVHTSAGACKNAEGGPDSDAVEDMFGETVVQQAVWTQEIQTTTSLQENLAFDWRQDTDQTHTEQAVAAVPICYGGMLYSILSIYTNRPAAFGAEELEILSQIGAVVGHAIADSERTQALMSDELIEAEVKIPNVFTQKTPPPSDWTVDIIQTVAGSKSDYLMYGTTSEDNLDSVAAVVDSLDDVELTVIGGQDEEVRVVFHLFRQCVIPLLASHGWSTEETVLTNGDCYLTVHLPSGDNVRKLIECICEVFPNAELLARRQIHVNPKADTRIQESALTELTDRQRTVLQTAYAAGYFEWPRDTTGEEIANSLGISPPTFHQHLRLGQEKLMTSIFNELPVKV